MDGSSDWRFKTHLANLPIYYEYKEDGIITQMLSKELTLITTVRSGISTSTTLLANQQNFLAKTADDATADFVTGDAVFYQNGTWEYNNIKEMSEMMNMGMLPIYIGVEGEENQGLCTGTENYWCVNKESI